MERLLVVVVFVVKSIVETWASCPVVHQADIRVLEVRLQPHPVPQQQTTYVCQQFQVPDLETYHAVAFEPLIGNEDAVHHMLLFGCDHDFGTDVGIYPSYYFTFEVTWVTQVTYCNWLSSVVMRRPLFIVN